MFKGRAFPEWLYAQIEEGGKVLRVLVYPFFNRATSSISYDLHIIWDNGNKPFSWCFIPPEVIWKIAEKYDPRVAG